jgi:radical SAM/Cys-rich protein
LRVLNALGYGIDPELPLDLVYNPLGAVLPPSQASLETAYREALRTQFGISFTHLLTITNVPIGRFRGDLRRSKQDDAYLALLRENHNPNTVRHLMCRHQISVRWDGALFDCDFNLAEKRGLAPGPSRSIFDADPESLRGRRIATADYCHACTAGAGSSCGGALV